MSGATRLLMECYPSIVEVVKICACLGDTAIEPLILNEWISCLAGTLAL
jgi:hypothetical protein